MKKATNQPLFHARRVPLSPN